MIFDNYPYTNFHEMNDDWIIKTLREFDKRLDEFVTMNSLTYADPIEYNPESIYPANTVVIYNDTAYVSKQTIPAGVLPTTGGEFWLEIFPFGALIEQGISDMERQIDEYIASANAQLGAAINTIPTLVNNWMDNHPDVTTTVQDEAISWLKLNNNLRSVLMAGYDVSASIEIIDFEQGAIGITNGTNVDSTFMCRTGFHEIPAGIAMIRTIDGFRIQVFRYNLDGTFVDRVLEVVRTTWQPFVTDENHKYRVSISYEDYSTLTPTDLPALPAPCFLYDTGYTELEKKLDLVEQEAYSGKMQITSNMIEQGAITNAGADTDNDKRIRCGMYIPIIPGASIMFTPGTITTSYAFDLYRMDGTHIAQYSWIDGDYTILTADAAYVRIFFRTGDGTGDIAPSDFDAAVYIKTAIANNADKSVDIENDLGIVDYYAGDRKTLPVAGATNGSCIGYELHGYTIKMNGRATISGGKIRTLITYKLFAATTANSLKTNVAGLIPLIKGHQYKMTFRHVSGTTSANTIYAILRNSTHADKITVAPYIPVKTFTWDEDNGGYIFLYSTTANQIFTDYTFEVKLTDETVSRFGVNESDYYKIAEIFDRSVIYERSLSNVNGHAQGMCSDGTYLYLAALTGTPRTNGRIMKVTTAGALISENDLGDIGHMNQLAYDPVNNLILAVGTDAASDPYVYRINPATLAVVDYLTLTNVKTALAAKHSHTGMWAIAYDANKGVWIVGNTECYAITNSDFSVIYRVCVQSTSGDGQGLYPFGDVVYSSFYGGTYDFVAFDWHGRTIHQFNKQDNAYGEFEGCCKINNDLYAYWSQPSNTILLSKDTPSIYRYVSVASVEKQFSYCD